MKQPGLIPVWKKAPVIRLLIPLTAGIILEFFLPAFGNQHGLTLILCAMILLFSLLVRPMRIYGWEWMTGLAIQMAFFSLGRILMEVRKDKPFALPAGFRNQYFFVAGLESDPVEKTGSFKCIATIRYLCNGTKSCLTEKEKIFIYFRLKQLPGQLKTGALIIFKKPPIPIKDFDHSAGFDYERYCLLKHIQGQVFLRQADFLLTGKHSSLGTILISWRKKIIKIVREYVPGNEESALLEALLIGYEDDLDRSLIQSYADTGVVHIIAISGLHLALIYQILQFFINKIRLNGKSKWIKTVMLIGMLWLFSLLSGASPSVLRSAVMFSFMLLAGSLSRESAAGNSLAAAAFMMLCFDPYWLWDTGFQLSYSAVLSLIIFLEPLQGLVHLKNKILAGVWKSISVSLSAQMLTTPVTLFYFHRFPSYFLLANLLAVPLSSFILAGGILLCLLSFFSPAAILVGWVLEKSITLLNVFITYTARLPCAVINGIDINLPQVFVLYLLIFSCRLFCKTGKGKWLLSSLICIGFFLLIRVWRG